MYSRAARFKSNVLTGTSERVGPATYIILDGFDIISKDGETLAPFNTSAIRNTSFVNRSVSDNPSPNKYKICFRKHRIVGGSSLQNKAPRIKRRTFQPSRGPYPVVEAKRIPGKVHVGVPPRTQKSAVTSIPEKGTKGYDITSQGPVKIVHPDMNKFINPAEYYNPKSYDNFTTWKYKGNFWSLRTAERFQYKEDEESSPSEFNVVQPVKQWQKTRDFLRMTNVTNAPLLRTLDLIQQKNCRENLPGPAQYFPKHQTNLNRQFGKKGTFSTAERKTVEEPQFGPGPAAYSDPRLAINTTFYFTPSAFGVTSDRFMESKEAGPGPSDYTPKNDMWNEIQKKGHSKYSKWNAPFASSADRKTTSVKPDSGCIPGPDQYFPQFQKRADENVSSMFASKVSQGIRTCAQVSPGPAAYYITDSFKMISTKKSHMTKTLSAFLTSDSRVKSLHLSSVPAPNTYSLPSPTSNGRSFGLRHKRGREKYSTPGPADYKINSKFLPSTIFNTHNVTLQPQKPILKSCTKTGPKKLRSFSEKKYITGHC